MRCQPQPLIALRLSNAKNNLTRPEITRAAPGNIFKRRYASELMKKIYKPVITENIPDIKGMNQPFKGIFIVVLKDDGISG